MLVKTLLISAAVIAVASPVADVSGDSLVTPVSEMHGGLQFLEARKVCAAGYLACHYRYGFGDPDQAEYTCMSPTCAFLRDCNCPHTASFNQKPAFLFTKGCRSKAAARNHPKCFVVS
ncbi:hypothetical protein COL26b_002001 [Colletotrichum chrysophilum]|uniref:Uncharacterized protein n=1 Tax=Colletotrichum chrysophilum TaxID=1836956 RepID=A0AAD9AXH7_9PEZI|nr:uncharacterized protein COL26b_002001 [Colletotrichum chrysophilum]KAJ0349002.1 hypothetical protein KNSL1_005047 [Colletotrichum chrysophilum]KAJ0379848.1 hypothetical protein COL26b_002001 [Colletotrichum chrysophilum]KAK1856311.1 hypothetical protein CCHR01_01059 [Colletotrichum chrysophilum]